MYEEDITNPSNATPAYTSYYSFADKLVGMRKGNQTQQGVNNGQYRVVGDALGSTSLIVDLNSSPNVLQRTYYKPYGEVAWSWSSVGGVGYASTALTSVGYTGQRLEGESGLMYYVGRFYDPLLASFVSADNAAPDPTDSRTRNRYDYTLNNPLRYTDSTGHCTDNATTTCAGVRDTLARYGFAVNLNDWDDVQDLQFMIEAIRDLLSYMRHSGDDYQYFKERMGIGKIPVNLVNVDKPQNPADILPGDQLGCQDDYMCTGANGRYLGVSESGFKQWYQTEGNGSYEQFFKYNFVHELGHLMDNRHDNAYSRGINNATHHPCFLWFGSCPSEGRVSARAYKDDTEDWAETVAAEVYYNYQPDATHGSHNEAFYHREDVRCALRGECAPPYRYGPDPYCTNINGCK